MPLEPIPTPPGQQWYEFKLRWLPVIVFSVALIVTLVTWRNYLSVAQLTGEVETIQVQACSPASAMVAELKVRGFQQVTAGQELARVVAADPKAPGIITAPVDGYVSHIFRQAGEKVRAGEPVMTISALHADRVVAFLRQPVRFTPVEGQPVIIRPRARAGSAQSTVLKAGPQLAPIRPTLLPAAQAREELGLPVIIAVPAGLKLFAGEIVDLTLLPPTPPAPVVPVKAAQTNAPAAPAPAPTPAPTNAAPVKAPEPPKPAAPAPPAPPKK